MAYTQTKIGQLAMGHLGDRDIENINDTLVADAVTLKNRYEHARDHCYEAHDWKWAKRSAALQLVPGTPTLRFTYQFALPPYFARIANVSEYSDMRVPMDASGWDISDGLFLTDAGFAHMEYVAKDWSEAKWPAYFADCVALKLAELACLKITHSVELKKALANDFAKVVMPQARSIDSTSQPAKQHAVTSLWQQSRLSRHSFSNLRRS